MHLLPKRLLFRTALAVVASLLLFSGCGKPAQPAKPAALRIGYSDWPGWVAWQVGIEKGWFAEAGVEVTFEWFDYVASMEAFSAGKLDAVAMTNGDALVTGAAGAPSRAILINDYSNGNDMVVAKPGIASVADLKGKRIGVEVGFVGHLLLLKALEANGLAESDVTLVNIPTHETPQAFASGDVDAVVAWQPNSSQALAAVPGSTAIFSSADAPGLIYDVLAVSPASLSARPEDWKKVVQVWYRIVEYIENDATRADAVRIMASRVSLQPEEYAVFLKGTKLLTLPEAKARYAKAEGLESIYGSNDIVDAFNVANGVYETPQKVDEYIYPDITLGL